MTLWINGRKYNRWRPYRFKYTGSLLNSEVKWHRAWPVLGWGTAWEALKVLPAFFSFFFLVPNIKLKDNYYTHIIQVDAKKNITSSTATLSGSIGVPASTLTPCEPQPLPLPFLRSPSKPLIWATLRPT